jgi:uncharacterized membrane protein
MRGGGGGGPFEEAQVAGVVVVSACAEAARTAVAVVEAVLEVLVARHLYAAACGAVDSAARLHNVALLFVLFLFTDVCFFLVVERNRREKL